MSKTTTTSDKKTAKKVPASTHAHEEKQPTRHPEVGDNKELSISIPWETVKVAYDQVLTKYRPMVKTDGFRKGKVPVKIVEQMVGPERLVQDTAERVLPKAYFEAVQKSGFKPVSDPEIHPESIELGKDWTFHAHIAEKPEVKLGKFGEVVKKSNKTFADEQKKAQKAAKPAKKAKDAKTTKKDAATQEEKPEAKK